MEEVARMASNDAVLKLNVTDIVQTLTQHDLKQF